MLYFLARERIPVLILMLGCKGFIELFCFCTVQILILDGEKLRTDPPQVMLEVQKFLGVNIYDYNKRLRWVILLLIVVIGPSEWRLIQSVIIGVINKREWLRNRSSISWSQLWLQTELDSTKSCYQLIKTMTKFEKETRPIICFHLKKKKTVNSMKCETTAHMRDVFCPLTQARHVNCPITLSNYKHDV